MKNLRLVLACAAASLCAACGGLPGDISRATGIKDTPAAAEGLREWKAEAAMVSNHGVYRSHEFVYQDYVHDDHGVNTNGISHLDLPFGSAGPDPADPLNLRLSPAPTVNNAGDYAYAVSGMHMHDVADLIEMRVAADAGNVYWRFTLADMGGPNPVVIGICANEDGRNDTGFGAWPFGAGLTDRLGCEHFYTIHNDDGAPGAFVTDGSGNSVDLATLGGAVTADAASATIEMRVPRSVADPGNGTWRIVAGSGLWDPSAQKWLAPMPVPSVVPLLPFPTGGLAGAPLIWDLLSNNGEPNSVWMEERQANELLAQNVINDYVDVDFARLAQDGDDADPQQTGVVERIYHSAYPTEEVTGRDIVIGVGIGYLYEGPWQPYAAVIPDDYYDDPKRAFPFDLCMHPLGANHNVEIYYSEALALPDYNPLTTDAFTPAYMGDVQVRALVNRLQAVYACTLGRGEALGYQGGDGLVDMLEVQADMLKRYRVDPERRTVHGVSLGAIGTWWVAQNYPDQYAAAMPYIFSPDITGGITAQPTFANLYNLPVFFTIGTADEFGQGIEGDPTANQLEGFGNEYVYLHYIGRQHEGRIEDDFLPFSEKLAYPRVRVKDPARVRFVFDPTRYSDKLPGNGSAYWVSGMTQRDTASTASVDAVSLARADQLPAHQVIFDSLALNTRKGYVGRFRGLLRMSADEFTAFWHPELWEPGWQTLSMKATPSDLEVPAVENGFTLTAVNLGSVTLDAARMKLAGGLRYSVTTDGPLEIKLSDGRSLSFAQAGTFDGTL